MKKIFEILGHEVVDKVTGFKGTAATICFDLYGCVGVVVSPRVKKGGDADGAKLESFAFDFHRLIVSKKKPVMERPDFAHYIEAPHGPAERPSRNRL